jgi:hypothetical protein
MGSNAKRGFCCRAAADEEGIRGARVAWEQRLAAAVAEPVLTAAALDM